MEQYIYVRVIFILHYDRKAHCDREEDMCNAVKMSKWSNC